MPEIREVQTLLKRYGRDPGDADGIVGPRTIDAVKLFEAARGWPVSGAVDLRLLDYLRSPRTPDPPSPQPSAIANELRMVDASADETAVVLRVLRDTAHPCPSLVRAVRVTDGSLRAICTNGEIYRITQLRGEWLALRCSAAERMGIKGC
jgi:peptidoglycan hydrolase-like protein with peptidoglycan-binding domain